MSKQPFCLQNERITNVLQNFGTAKQEEILRFSKSRRLHGEDPSQAQDDSVLITYGINYIHINIQSY